MTKSKKCEFNINNYEFKIVKFRAFNANDKENILDYYLLVDSSNFIHDYKIKFQQIYITPYTTPAHQITKPSSLLMRKNFLLQLGMQNSFENIKPKKYTLITNNKTIDKINEWSFHNRWNDIQFQQIEYLLRGSNSSGQGNGKGYLKLTYKGQKHVFGFFIKELNIYNKIKNVYTNISYKQVWDKYKDFNTLDKKAISFDTWMDSEKRLRDLFTEFVCSPKEWKQIKEDFRKKFQKLINEYIGLEKIISNYRQEYSKNIERKYQNLINEFFNINYSKNDYAHIKPVWYIKKEFLENKKDIILKQISNPNNFLPLPSDVHRMYDDYYFYWNVNGSLITIDNHNFSNDDIKRISGFNQINKNMLTDDVKWFLNEYEQVLKYKNLL